MTLPSSIEMFCPHCGEKGLKMKKGEESDPSQLIGLPCDNCGRVFTKKDLDKICNQLKVIGTVETKPTVKKWWF